ncbi:MAG: hypothetical protein AMS17_18465, partial [Spirochaetes bacterium DG_61]
MKIAIHTLLIVSLLTILTFGSKVHAQDYMNLNEPSWVYRGRGDRFYRLGDYGNAVAQYKKALVKRQQEYEYPSVEGVNIHTGLSRTGGSLDAYRRLLFIFRIDHAETVRMIDDALREGRYQEARKLAMNLRDESYTIGAEQVYSDVAQLEQSIFKRNREIWDSLLKDLSNSMDIVLKSLDSLDVEYETGNTVVKGEKLVLHIEKNIPYPEVNLALARIYRDEKLYDLALNQIALFEQGRDHLQIPDTIFEAMYLRAEIYHERAEVARAKGNEKTFNREITAYGEELDRIIGYDANWMRGKEESGFGGYADRKLSDIPVSAVQYLNGDLDGREKYGKAYFLNGALRFEKGRYESAEPYLKMAYLYGYERENAKEYLIQYYSAVNDRKS